MLFYTSVVLLELGALAGAIRSRTYWKGGTMRNAVGGCTSWRKSD